MFDIEQITSDLLNRFNLMKAPIDVKSLIRKMNIKLESRDFNDEISGVLVTENGKAKIGYSKNESPQRQRFTLAHELGHYKLHLNEHKNNLFLDNVKVMYRKQAITRTEKNQEIEANRFAACLLMPEELLREKHNNLTDKNYFMTDDEIIIDLSKEFKVSQIAMTYRLTNLGLIEQFY